jgi:secreted trypsin-like serine protease
MRFIMLFALMLGGCGSEVSLMGGSISTRGTRDSSAPDVALQIQNGSLTNEMRVGSLRVSGRHFCTVSLVGPSLALTAAHCAKHSLETLSVLIDRKTYRVSRIVQHPNYAGNGAVHQHDLALMKLNGAPGLEFGWFDQVKPDSLARDERLTLIGLGRDENEVSGVQKSGTMKFLDFHLELNMAVLVPDERQQASCAGDSGGVVLDGFGRIVGTVSGGFGAECGNIIGTIITNLGAQYEWFDQQSKEMDLRLPHRIAVAGPGSVSRSSCVEYKVQARNSRGTKLTPAFPLEVAIDGGAAFSERSCTQSIRSFAFAVGEKEKSIFINAHESAEQMIVRIKRLVPQPIQAPFLQLKLEGERKILVKP